jgi:hypothetical protein
MPRYFQKLLWFLSAHRATADHHELHAERCQRPEQPEVIL